MPRTLRLRWLTPIFALGLIFGMSTAAFAQSPSPTVGDLMGTEPIGAVTDNGRVELILDADDGLSDDEVKAIGRQVGVNLKLNSDFSDEANLYIGWVDAPRLTAVLDRLENVDGVEAAEANQQLQAFGGPNDPLYQYQWHFDQVNAESVWRTGAGEGVIVAVIDTGVAYANSKDGKFIQAKDLAANDFAPGYDFVDDDDQPYDEHGHGTHVAGTIAQTTNNGYGVAGLAFKARIMPLRVLNAHGSGSTADIADAIRFAADNGAKVINMSLGGPLPSLVMRSAVRYAHAKGVTIIAAAGNAGRRMRSYPAAYKHVVAVAATQYDKNTTFYSQWGSFVDIAAPGGNTRVDQNKDGRPDGVLQETLKEGDPGKHDFALYMGTSMASPHVAAAAAIVIGLGVNHPDRVEAILQKTAIDGNRNIDSYDERYGAGILDASAAASSTQGCTGMLRLGLGGILTFLLTLLVRRKDVLGLVGLSSWFPFSAALVMGASGLFFLPWIVGDAGALGIAADLFGRPLGMLDLTLFGPNATHNPLLASAAIPALGVALGLGNKHARHLAAGLAIGFASFLLIEAAIMPSDVQWIPGMNVLDRVWLASNGLISATLGYLALKRY